LLAHGIQQSFLPKIFPDNVKIDVWGTCVPAKEVGGDYFDFFPLSPSKYGIVIGDVSGKGVAAALFMAVSRTLFRILSSQESEPEKVIHEFNQKLVNLDQDTNMFITLFYAIFDINSHKLTYSTAGHNMPFIKLNSDNSFKMLPKMQQTMLAGMIDDIPVEVKEISMSASGDTIILYTDGITEAINEKEEEYGEERVIELLQKCKDDDAQTIGNRIIDEVKAFQPPGKQFDDMTLIILKVK